MEKEKDNKVQTYESIWSQWKPDDIKKEIQQHRTQRTTFLDLISECLQNLDRRNVRILEVGCGSSIDTHIIAQKIDGKAFGVDISQNAINIAHHVSKHFFKKVILDVQDARRLKFEDNFFDLVFSQGLLEHFENPFLVIEEQLRVLKSGGILVINVPQRFTVYTIYKHILMMRNKWPWGKEGEFSYGDLKHIAKGYNLKIIDKAGYGYWLHWLEVVWILRSLSQKLRKIWGLKKSFIFGNLFEAYDSLWAILEKKLGHLFLKNVVCVYKKL